MATKLSPADRFEHYINRNGPVSLIRGVLGPCWLWTGAPRRTGSVGEYGEDYGAFYLDGRKVYAHRFAYELTNGPLPAGMVADHRCRRRNCTRPSHLDPVPQRTNVLRGTSFAARRAAQTECVNGHDLTDPANVYRRPDTGTRQCRSCARDRDRNRRRTTNPERQAA